MPKKYTSYDQIDNELKMLKLKKEIHRQYIALSIKEIKASLQPKNLLYEVLNSWFCNFYKGN